VAALLAVFASSSAQAQSPPITVVVNGQRMHFDQPPIEQAGRVFVPLRGVFEQLGASVVYQNGIINATGNGRQISLRIGSRQATIDGQTQTLDVPPFTVGARTLVPLRFVAQALGATVDWNQATSTVTVIGGQPAFVPPPPPTPVQPARLGLTAFSPLGTVTTLFPAIHADFVQPVRPDSLRVSIDGIDYTQYVFMNAHGFNLTPPTALQPGAHRVQVDGVTFDGTPVSGGWGFFTTPAVAENFINGISPANLFFTNRPFVLFGRTLPFARVHVVATQRSSIAGIIFIDTNTYETDAVANSAGAFSVNLDQAFVRSGPVNVLLQSIAPGGASVEQRFTMRF
jgi:hypothetical protein